MDLLKIKQELILASQRCYARGVQTGTGGNVSARVPGEDLMIVKPSGKSFGDCTVNDLLITDFDGKLVEGEGKPTREALLHGFIYKKMLTVSSVVHCHAPWSIGWSSTKKDLPLVTYHAILKIGYPIPTLDIKAGVVSPTDFYKVEEIFKKNPNLIGFLLVDHGIVAVGNNAINAEHNLELIEETAKIAYLKALAKKLLL